MKAFPLLRKARILLEKKQYLGAVKLLSPQIFMYRNNAEYFYLLAGGCLLTQDYSGALSHYQRCEDIDPTYPGVLHGLALVYLLQNDESAAVRYWLAILDKHPTDKKAIRALELVKNSSVNNRWHQVLEIRQCKELIPAWLNFPFGSSGIFVKIALGVFMVVIVYTTIVRTNTPPQRRGEEVFLQNPIPTNSILQNQVPINTWTLSTSEEQALIGEIKENFRLFKDNQARRLINKILFSNASQQTKDQVRLLLDHLGKPDFTNFKDETTYIEFLKQPLFYDGSYIRWRGRVSKLELLPDSMKFVFLLGYENNQVVEATIPTVVPFAIEVYEKDAIEIIAQIIIPDGLMDNLYLKVSSLRRIYSGAKP